MFEAAAVAHPGDVDVHTALGVVYNLTRDYDQAVEVGSCSPTFCTYLWGSSGSYCQGGRGGVKSLCRVVRFVG